MDYWIIKIDGNGNLVWQKAFGGSDYDDARSVQATSDGGCIVAGSSYSVDGNVAGNHGAGDYWVIKLDRQGNLQWQKALGGSMTENAACVQVAGDGGYIVSGYANSQNGDVTGNRGGYDSWIVKLDAGGNIAWQRCYGGSQNESANYIRNTNDGGYVFTGMSFSSDGDVGCNAGLFDVLVVKINAAGQLEWQKTIGGQRNDEGVCVQQLNDGSFIVLAYTESPDIPNYHTPAPNADGRSDYWIIKLTPSLAAIPAPVVTIDPASAFICPDRPATFTASVLNAGINPVYQWTRNGVNAGSNSPVYTDANLAANDQIRCTVAHGNICETNGQQGADDLIVQLKANVPDPQITITSDHFNACDCATITIRARVSNPGGSPRYQWMVNGNNTGTNSPVFMSSTLKNGDVITCSYTDNTVCASGGDLSNPITIGSGNSSGVAVTIATSAEIICKGTMVTFTANPVNAGANPFYQWKINNNNVGANGPIFTSTTLSHDDVVSCTITSDPTLICTPVTTVNSNSILIHVLNTGMPEVNIVATAETICTDATVSFTVTAISAGANPSYQWKLNGINTGVNDKQFTSSSLANNDVVSCTVTVDPFFNCAVANQAVSNNIIMTVHDAAIPDVQITADRNSACVNESISFTAVAEYAGTHPTYEWILNNAVVPGSSPVYSSSGLKNGDRLFCRIIPGQGACSLTPDSSNIIVVAINDTPVVRISPADTIISTGTQVYLQPFVTGSIASFQWSPAGKLTDPQSFTTQTVLLNESTNYRLVVEDDNGCRGMATSAVKILTQLYMPSAFTPNNDGVNDLFRIPPASPLMLVEFSIFNRWGSRVFTTKNSSEGWDGIFNGKKQDAGVYVYFIKAAVNGREFLFKGNFTLVR